MLIRTAIFKPANALVGFLLQAAAERIDAAYVPKPGEYRKERQCLRVDGIFGSFALERDYYYHEGKKAGALPSRYGPGSGGGLYAGPGPVDVLGGSR